MAPSPEDDNAPKAPDKSDKNKCDKVVTDENAKEKDKEEKTLSNLNDGELKALLDEAITYKNPKDREGKSKLFKDLLIEAEESERIARATSAGGSELVRHCNPSARRNAAVGSQRHHQGRRKSSRRMASETVMHGGSLDNLAQEELFLESTHHLMMRDKPNKRTAVSARQREGGSLPCDVNSSLSLGSANQFFEEAKRKKAMKEKPDYTGNEVESYETQRLLDHDTLAQNYEEVSHELTIVPRYTTRATLQISATPVDDPIPLDLDSGTDKKIYDVEALTNKVSHSKYSVFIPTYNRTPEEKKVDENGNALHQSSTKTKKKKKENVVVLNAESVEGHRSDIINDVDKLMQYIGGDEDTNSSSKPKSNFHKSKQLKQHISEDAQRGKKQRAHSSKGKESRGELKKSNSLGEISTTKLENFEFASEKEENKVVLRTGKHGQNDRPKERRSWGNVEPPSFQALLSNASTENLEAAENWVVTKPKKKNKKRRNSISSGGRRQNSNSESTKQPTNRAPSPDFRGNATRSVPHSDKSNDSSDEDSVHSLPIDDLNMPISYADIAKNSEKLKEKKSSPEKIEKVVVVKEKSPIAVKADQETKVQQNPKKSSIMEKSPSAEKSPLAHPIHNLSKSPPDVNNMKNFPAISVDSSKPIAAVSPTSKHQDPEELPVKNNTEIQTHVSADSQQPAKASPIATDIVVGNVKTTPPSSSSSISESSPKAPVQEVTSTKNLPPDVHNIRNFPAMPVVNKSLNVTEKNSHSHSTRNSLSVSGNKIRNISPGNNNSKSAKSGHNNNNNNNLKSSVRNVSNMVHNDIQNDLTIIHSNEKESIQFNAQMLPPDIPDVRTIEKMHFMNLTPSNNLILNSNPNQQHIPNQKTSPSANNTPPSTNNNAHLSQVPHTPAPAINVNSNSKQTVNSSNNSFNNNNNINNNVNYVNCDNSSDRTVVNDTVVVVVDSHHQQQQQPPQQQKQQQQQQQQQQEDDEERPPPVVILSGLGNKEVPGLVFGFDINEQLLHEDICESFISRYVEPENFKNSTHNHDKIVNFIGSAWEAIITQSNGKVQYYKEES